MSPAIFESHRRTPSGQDPERRKSGSGFLFLNNRFKSIRSLESLHPLPCLFCWTLGHPASTGPDAMAGAPRL
ncbi:hypothetical protein CH63R_00074 [Colletotrichum higginsianum IMI 349063]|uniref:Uncharacterized protein n=1 Tax=Colletotrichum higginsianum (strain IMI 349063) TaxID=759273 RepID=A0A1B7YSG3_COLHI|nr:hypothetical protein CH63R_00074 [Colletotrichum higginsianum IMI 349063]OBR14894.1 hypothetical protein CH63R_00074 [Colletotrichum higginsianum IMI 349063]